MKKSLVIFCSGTGFTREVFAFLEAQIPHDEEDFDVLSVPGCIYSLASSHEDFEHHQSSLGDQILFLVEKHNLSKILVLDHSNCAWFDELGGRDKAFFNRSSEEMLERTLGILRSLVPASEVKAFKGVRAQKNRKSADLRFNEIDCS